MAQPAPISQRLSALTVGGMQDLLRDGEGFIWKWIGQVIPLLGSAMTWFALTIWAYEQTGQATVLALLGSFSFRPTLLLSPVAGHWSIVTAGDLCLCSATSRPVW